MEVILVQILIWGLAIVPLMMVLSVPSKPVEVKVVDKKQKVLDNIDREDIDLDEYI